MENFFSRYRNETVLVSVLFFQLILLATQIKVQQPSGFSPLETTAARQEPAPTRLIRVWAVGLIAPFQRLGVHAGEGLRAAFHDYIDLRHVRSENQQLRQQLDQMRLQQDRIEQDAEQGKRLQALLGFREQFPSKTVAAQVIGTSGTDMSKVIYIDKGRSSGIANGQAVITADGIVGKVLRADKYQSEVLLINDPSSGAGVILERARLNGILKGSATGQPEVEDVMSDENVVPGDRIITSGGDRVFPKGLPVGVVESAQLDQDHAPFLQIIVKPAVNLSKLEEVLVVTEMSQDAPVASDIAVSPTRTVDMLAQRLPSAKLPDAPAAATGAGSSSAPGKPAPPKPASKIFIPSVPDRFSPGSAPMVAPNPEATVPYASTGEAKPTRQKAEHSNMQKPKSAAPGSGPASARPNTPSAQQQNPTTETPR